MIDHFDFRDIDHRRCDGLCISNETIPSSANFAYYHDELINAFHSTNSKIIWIRIPKTATVSLGSVLGLEVWNHYKATFVRDVLGQDVYANTLKFTFVRHPLDRLTSIYEYYRWHDVNNLRKGDICVQNFDDWVYRGCPHNIGKTHPLLGKMIPTVHDTLLQKAWLCDDTGKINMDFVGKVESFKHDSKKIYNFCQSLDPVAFPHGDARLDFFSNTHHNVGLGGIKAMMTEYYTSPGTRKRAEEIMKVDLDLFGY